MRNETQLRRCWRSFISIFIGAVVCLQTIVILAGWGARFYPFVNYGMYTRVHEEGKYIDVEYPVYVQTDAGAELRIYPEDVGMNFWKMYRFANRILEGRNEAAQQLMSIYESRTGTSLSGLRVASYPAIITRRGMREAPSVTLKVVGRDS